MKDIKQNITRDLIKAVLSDSIDFIGSYIPMPKATATVLFQKFTKNPLEKFVDWKLKNWKEFYHQEKDFVFLQTHEDISVLPQILLIDNTDKKIKEEDILFQIEEKEFKIPPHIQDLTEKAFYEIKKELNYFNEENVKLKQITKKGNKIVLQVQPVIYEEFVKTNLLMDAELDHKNTLRKQLHSDGKLESLEDSPLANHLGINVLVFTANGSLVMTKRSELVAFRRGELAPTISGTIAIEDITDGGSLQDMNKLREGFEELGIPKKILDQSKLHFLGITRELIRGGNPEIFFYVKTELTEMDFKTGWETAKDKWENRDLIFFPFGSFGRNAQKNEKKNKEELHERISAFMKLHENNASLPLLTNIALWGKSE